MATTRFHQATEAVLAEEGLPLATERVAVPDVGWAVPAAVAEWFTLPDAVEWLHARSNCDHPFPLAGWYEVPDIDHDEGAPLRVFMHENQHVCEWAVMVDGSDDPPVLVDVDGCGWVPCADRFSTFISCGAFDWPPGWLVVWTQTAPLTDRVRRHLDATLSPGPISHGWPGATARRYHRSGVRLTIWETDRPDWWLRARTEADLDAVLAEVSTHRLADLRHATGNDAVAEGILNRWRHRVSRHGDVLGTNPP